MSRSPIRKLDPRCSCRTLLLKPDNHKADNREGEISLVSEEPFPLRRYFSMFVLPGMLIVIFAIIYATTHTVRSATVEILLQLASQKVAGIAKGVETTAPDAWRKLLSNSPLSAADLADLSKAFADEQRELQISLLKIYGPDRRTVFATETDEIGKTEDKPELRNALERDTASVLVERDAEGGAFYELYLPYHSGGHIVAVFELYEPIAGFDSLVWKVTRPVVIIPVSLFTILIGTLAWLVARAQADISHRTDLIVSLRENLERLVSHRAVTAMRAEETKRFQAENLDVTLFYSDVRNFTGFAESRPALEVIDFLNRIIGLQVEIIGARGGDVDKMIGDAVLARFHGTDRTTRAVDAAIAIQKALGSADLPRGLAIGIFDGPVVAGLIGAAGRYDYTIVGDSVNVAARLCGLANEGEIVADNVAAGMSHAPGFGPEEVVSVKGRLGELTVRRIRTAEIASAVVTRESPEIA